VAKNLAERAGTGIAGGQAFQPDLRKVLVNAWNAHDWYDDSIGNNSVSRWLGGVAGNAANDVYSLCKRFGIPVGRDNPNVPPSDVTIQQWSWGTQGAWASIHYPANMQPGSPEWRSFIAWMESMY
jgi:hypothetical protein